MRGVKGLTRSRNRTAHDSVSILASIKQIGALTAAHIEDGKLYVSLRRDSWCPMGSMGRRDAKSKTKIAKMDDANAQRLLVNVRRR